MGLNEDDIRETVADFIARAAEADSASVLELARLGGGTIQENYALELEIAGGDMSGRQSLVLRTDSPSRVSVSLSRAHEFAVMRAAFDVGVTVPEPLWLCQDRSVIGKDFYIMRRAAGTASARELVRGSMADEARELLVERLGEELARLHMIEPPIDALAFLAIPDQSPALARIALYRQYLDTLPAPQPVLEWGLRWLEHNAPQKDRLVLCHSDYRTGNYMVEGTELRGILDWEFASWSDPHEDLSWFCARCWRFGAWEREAGGMGSRTAFYRGYERTSGHSVDASVIPYWEVMAAVRWAIIALQQAQRHLSGEQSSLELALTGRMVPEMELDMLIEIDRIDKRKIAYA